MRNKSKIARYVHEYEWSNIFEMIRNNQKAPKICTDDFKDKWVVITGATSGIGYYTARKFASKGASLVCINRNPSKSENLTNEIENEFGVQCKCLIADLSLLNDIFRVSAELVQLEQTLDVIIHNAGVYLTRRELTSDGLEKVFVVHYLASFIMNNLLMEKLKLQKQSRIIMVGSEGHRFAVWGLKLDDLNWEKRRYSGLKSYGSAKTAQLLSMLIFEEKFRDTGIIINTMHPGAVKTATGQENGPIYKWFKRNFFDKLLKSPEMSAEALYYLGVSDDVAGVSGSFFNLTTQEKPAPPASDMQVAQLLWGETLKITGLQHQNQ